MSRIQKVLFLGIMILPFTSLRFSFFGFGELIIFLSMSYFLFSSDWKISLLKPIRPFLFFWVFFFFFSTIGFIYNAFFLGFSSGRQYSFIFDGFSYFFVFSFLLFIGNSYFFNFSSPYHFFKLVFLGWGFIFSLLFAVSFLTPTIFGLPLRYYDYFSPLVENIHQAASLTCVMPFIILHLLKHERRFILKFLLALMAVSFCFMALGSGSTKALMGIVVGGAVSALSLFFYQPGNNHNPVVKMLVFFFLVSFGFLLAVSNFSNIDVYLEKFFLENDGGGARAILYTSGISHSLDSFLVGYGPGSHAPYGIFFSDAHNTLLTITLQSGVLGLIVFLLFIFSLLYRSAHNIFLSGGLVSALMYIIGGDIMRRLPIWIMLVGISYLIFYSKHEHQWDE